MNPGWALIISVLLLLGNAFFVAAEFALTAAKRYRLEDEAAAGSRAARAAIKGIDQLSLMLAGAQLGITLCTVGLGALAEPAVAHLIDPLLHATGMPSQLSYAIAFVISLVLVVFLHMVVGEMAPKSWALVHPERSALLLALPFRWFTKMTRWILSALNGFTNWLLRLVKVDPRDTADKIYLPEDLRILVHESGEHGTLPQGQERLLTRMLALQNTTLGAVMIPRDQTITVPGLATATEVEALSRTCGRSRFPVINPQGDVTGLIHIREVVRATAAGHNSTASELMTDPLRVPVDQPIATTVTVMRQARAQLAIVTDPGGAFVGIATMEDVLEELIDEFDDETDPLRT
jgi:CBS domain containing-hemolysin-like protein